MQVGDEVVGLDLRGLDATTAAALVRRFIRSTPALTAPITLLSQSDVQRAIQEASVPRVAISVSPEGFASDELRVFSSDEWPDLYLVLPPATSDAGLARLDAAPSVRHLHLVSSKLSEAGFRHLTRLRQLAGLSLEHAQVGDSVLQLVGEISGLAELNLTGSAGFTNKGLAGLESLGSLQRL